MKTLLLAMLFLFTINLPCLHSEESESLGVVSFLNKPDYLYRGNEGFFLSSGRNLEIVFKIIELDKGSNTEGDPYLIYHNSLKKKGIPLSDTDNIISFYRKEKKPVAVKYKVSKYVGKNLQKEDKNSPIVEDPISYENMYKVEVNLKDMKEGKYYFEFPKTIKGKALKHLPGEYGELLNVFEIKPVKTKRDRAIIILDKLWFVEKEKGLMSTLPILEEAFSETEDLPNAARFQMVSYYHQIAKEKKDRVSSIAWWLLLARFNKTGKGIVPKTYGGWKIILQDEKNIEKKAAQFKDKYFADVKYVYEPKKLNLKGIYEDKQVLELTIDMQENGKSKKEIEIAIEKAFPGYSKRSANITQQIKEEPSDPDLILSVKEDGNVQYKGKDIKREEISKLLLKKRLNKNSRVLVIGHEKCKMDDVTSILKVLRENGIEENLEFRLENEL